MSTHSHSQPTDPSAISSLLVPFLLRTDGVVEVVAIETETIGTVVGGVLRRFLLDVVGLSLLGRSLRDLDVVVVVGLDVLLCE